MEVNIINDTADIAEEVHFSEGEASNMQEDGSSELAQTDRGQPEVSGDETDDTVQLSGEEQSDPEDEQSLEELSGGEGLDSEEASSDRNEEQNEDEGSTPVSDHR